MRGKGGDRTAILAKLTCKTFRLTRAYLIGKDQVATLGDRKLHAGVARIDVRPGECLARWRS